MRRCLLFCATLLPALLQAQELLMNGSFEEENICTEYEKNCAPEGWISTSLYADYYFDDEVHAYTGNHFTGIILARKEWPYVRNYLRSRLLCGLRKGAQYKLQLHIRSNHQLSDSIGAYFSAHDFLYQKDKIMKSHPQVFLPADKLLATGDWQKIELIYTADGTENYINIGDFKTRGHDFKKSRPDLNHNYYFFLDSISLTPLNAAELLCTEVEATKEEEYNFNVRHDKLDRLIYLYTKNPPPVVPLPKTILQRVDTLVIPDVFFATNSYALKNSAFAVLDSFRKSAARLAVDSLIIEGHTDSQGTLALNQKLSENRASAVAQYLQTSFKATIKTRGWANAKPVADNKTNSGRQQNRRVEIYIYVRE